MLRSKYLFLFSLLFLYLCSCSALMQSQEPTDVVAMNTARNELTLIRLALNQYRAENDSSSYPQTSQITNHYELPSLPI